MRSVVFAAMLFFSVPVVAQVVVEAVEPRRGATSGGTVVTITGRNLGFLYVCPILCPGSPSASVGGRAATITQMGPDSIVLVTPSNASVDPVDITLTGIMGTIVELRGAFTYVASETHPVRLLVPVHISFPAPGAHGSLWSSELWLRNTGSETFQLTYARVCDFPGQPYVCGGALELTPARTMRFVNGAVHTIPGIGRTEVAGPSSPFLLVPRNRTRALAAHLRVQDLSRASTTFGTELPLVPEDRFGFGPIELPNVPTDAAFRVSLRVYDGAMSPITYRADIVDESGAVLRQLQLSPRFWSARPMLESAAVAEAHDLVEGLSGRVTVRIVPTGTAGSSLTFSPFWAMITVTHRDTQHVTTITPSR